MENKKEKKDFNLIILLANIAVTLIIFAVLFFVFNPVQKFKSARDAERWADVSSIIKSLEQYNKDNEEANLFKEIDGLYREDWYMIVAGPKLKGCDDQNKFSDVEIFDDDYCLDFSVLIDKGYIGELPVSPEGGVNWDKGLSDKQTGTGYAFMIDEDNVIHIQSCESENTSEIQISKKIW